MEIIKLSPWNDPVTYALPGFILSILAEAYILFVKRKQKINKKDASASLSLGLGVVFLDLAFKPLFLALGLFLFKFRILEHIGPGSVEEFFDLSWHKAHWYLWVVLFFLDDFTFYWFHRWMHEIRVFWACHVNHHDSQYMHLSTALRQSWTEYFFKYPMWFWLVILGFHPLMIMFMMQLNLIYQYWPHTELIPKLGWFDRIFNSPSNHRVHHGSNLQYLDRNYGGILIIWDRIFGTWEPENEKVRYGITTNINTYNPFKITAHEWINIKNDLKRAPNLRAKFNYLFNSPGWSHDGEDQRAKTLRANMEKKD